MQHYDKILAMLGELRFGKNIEVTFVRRAALEAWTGAWNFGYQLSICCLTEKNHGNYLIELVYRRMHSAYCMHYKDPGDPECRNLRNPKCRDHARFVPAFLYRY